MGPSAALRVWLLILTAGSLRGLPTERDATEPGPQIRAEERGGPLNLEHLLQTLPSSPSSTRHRSPQQDAVPPPVPEEEPTAFVLDLRNFPDLANADVGSENPNIQVTIEVMEESQAEVEMDLAKENQLNDWSGSPSEWISSNRKLFWPLFWEYPDKAETSVGGSSSEEHSEDNGYDLGEPVRSGVGATTGRGWNQNWETKDSSDYEGWSDWAPCSVTCGSGSQKRTRSCGYACTATESRTCELESCSNAGIPMTDATSAQLASSVDPGVESCEKWLSCRSEFLQKYLDQVLGELPSCPCSYPSEVIYGAISIQESRRRRAYRWRDASGPKERLDIYKPSARFCIRSMLSYNSATLGAQHCCYDDRLRLITRGKGAGAPDLISAEFSPELHHQVDVLPWILCKGDWSRFHLVRPPNNGLGCTENPPELLFQTELREAREY